MRTPLDIGRAKGTGRWVQRRSDCLAIADLEFEETLATLPGHMPLSRRRTRITDCCSKSHPVTMPKSAKDLILARADPSARCGREKLPATEFVHQVDGDPWRSRGVEVVAASPIPSACLWESHRWQMYGRLLFA